FATLGADPASDHARLSLEAASSLLPRSSRLLGTFCCRGRVDPELVKKMYEMFPPQSLHGRNPASESRIRAASTHPDETDLAQAAAFARRMMEKE
ncbi:MAG TPA: flavodoxin, partial [Acidaminococcaceae bacterium]|nr:flavodoxin [Acidaminococcaceae bacterium]